MEQEVVEVWKGGVLLSVMPKAAERTIREIFSGNPDERVIRIIDPKKRAEIEVEQKVAMEKIATIRAKVENEKVTALQAQVDEMKAQLAEALKKIPTSNTK